MVAILAVLLLSGLSVILAGTTSEGLLFLEENAKKPGVVTLPSGLQYSVLRSGSGTTSPTESTVCQCHYRGTTIDGVEFDSSYRRGTPTSFSPNQVIPGWREALQLMKEGDSWQLVIPSELAYGDRSMGPHIKPGSVLVFELSLEKISSPTAMTYFQRWFGGGPPIWMLLTAYFAYILIFRVGPFIKEKFFPDKKKGPVVPLEMALGAEGNSLVYLDVAVGSEKPARIEITLFDSIAPKTAENFRALCTGEKGVGRLSKPLHFKGSQFHRIIPGFMAQGGDITEFNGRGGESIYGEKFDDELDIGIVEHSTEGLLSMANSGKNTNGSQFFITFAPTAWLNGKHVVFGKVTKGMEVVKTLESIGTSSGNPKVQAMVVDCGEIKSSKKEN